MLLFLFHWFLLWFLLLLSTTFRFALFFVFQTIQFYRYHLFVTQKVRLSDFLTLTHWTMNFPLMIAFNVSCTFCCIMFSFNSENLRETLRLNDTIHQKDITDIDRIFCQNNKDYRLYSTVHGIFYKEHILDTNLSQEIRKIWNNAMYSIQQ